MAELLITSSIDPVKKNDVFTTGLPRHVTIWQDFSLPDFHMAQFEDEVHQIVTTFWPLQVVGAERDMFGANNDTPVRRVIALGYHSLHALHVELGGVIDRYDGEVKNLAWAYDGFNPHVTYVDNKALGVCEYTTMDTVELVERIDNPKGKRIRKVWELGGV